MKASVSIRTPPQIILMLPLTTRRYFTTMLINTGGGNHLMYRTHLGAPYLIISLTVSWFDHYWNKYFSKTITRPEIARYTSYLARQIFLEKDIKWVL